MFDIKRGLVLLLLLPLASAYVSFDTQLYITAGVLGGVCLILCIAVTYLILTVVRLQGEVKALKGSAAAGAQQINTALNNVTETAMTAVNAANNTAQPTSQPAAQISSTHAGNQQQMMASPVTQTPAPQSPQQNNYAETGQSQYGGGQQNSGGQQYGGDQQYGRQQSYGYNNQNKAYDGPASPRFSQYNASGYNSRPVSRAAPQQSYNGYGQYPQTGGSRY